MRQDRGPGKVNADFLTSGDTTNIVTALLFNFDFDWDDLKDEHRYFIDEYILPLLELPNWKATVFGSASRVGAKQYNQVLSEKRSRNVENYILVFGKSHDPSQFDQVTGLGEPDPSSGTANDDDLDRSVTLVVFDGKSGPDEPTNPLLTDLATRWEIDPLNKASRTMSAR